MNTRNAQPLPRLAGPVRVEALTLLTIYAVLATWWLLRVQSFQIPYHYWQLLPADALRRDFGQAMLDLHAQPPWLNLVFGACLNAADATGTRPETWACLLQCAVGGLTVLALHALSLRLLVHAALRRIVLGAVVLNPFLYATVGHLFYTGYELAFLAFAALALHHYAQGPSPQRLALFLLPALLLVLARAVFPPLWFGLVWLVALALARARFERQPRAWIAVSVVAALLVCAWPAKNLIRFGFFGTTSWSGYNLSRGLPLHSPVIETVFERDARTPPDPKWQAFAQKAVPLSMRSEEGVAAISKSDGSPNWNHASIIPASRALGRGATEYLLEKPSRLWRRAKDYYLSGFTIYEGRNPYTGELGWDVAKPDPPRGGVWPVLYEALLFQRFSADAPRDGEARPTTGFAFTLPWMLLFAALMVWRRRRAVSPADSVVAFMLGCIVWVAVLVLTVDGMESNRMRFPLEPYLLLALAWAVEQALASLAARRRDASAP